jgi:hypothetical protein
MSGWICVERPARCGARAAARAAAASVAAAAAAGAVPAGHDDIFRIDGRPPVSAVVTAGGTWNPRAALETEMGRRAAGVLALYDRATIAELLRCATARPAPPHESARRVALVHLRAADGASRVVGILRAANGTPLAAPLDPRPPGGGGDGRRPAGNSGAVAVLLDPARLARVSSRWPAYRGGFEAPPLESAMRLVLERPYAPGRLVMDRRTMSDRLYRGMPVAVQDADRDLGNETLHARIPSGYDARHPAGLLVWSSPTADGRIPIALDQALDELGLVGVAAADAGNDRGVPEKFQLVFDAVATAAERFHVDERRVYIAGMSGGGKVCSILALCFPEVFAGALAIVGFGTYAELDDSFGGHRMPYFARPRDDRLELGRTRRIALVGGVLDYNYREMVERQRRLEADGFSGIRFFAWDDMGHEMPSPQRFAEAMRWVDEPLRKRRAEADAAAAAQLLEYLTSRRDDPRPADEHDRQTLRGIVEAAPWSRAAWDALRWLEAPWG